MNRRIFRNTEWSILICVVILTVIGLVALYSATIDSGLEGFKKQVIWIIISIPVLIGILYLDYSFISRVSPYLYGIAIVLLIAVLFTSSINGARSWFNIGFFAFQPAELAKVFVIVFVSKIIVDIQKNDKGQINRPLNLIKILGCVLIPTV